MLSALTKTITLLTAHLKDKTLLLVPLRTLSLTNHHQLPLLLNQDQKTRNYSKSKPNIIINTTKLLNQTYQETLTEKLPTEVMKLKESKILNRFTEKPWSVETKLPSLKKKKQELLDFTVKTNFQLSHGGTVITKTTTKKTQVSAKLT